MPSLQGWLHQLDENDAPLRGHQHWKQESFTSKRYFKRYLGKDILRMMRLEQKGLELHSDIKTVTQLSGNNW